MLKSKFSKILDISKLREVLHAFYELTGYVLIIKDVDHVVLITEQLESACEEFHRKHPDAISHCDLCHEKVNKDIQEGKLSECKCGNGIWDIAGPIIVDGEVVAIYDLGQYFRTDEEFDKAFFEAQAEQYGFDKEAYFRALEKIPRISPEKLDKLKQFAQNVARQIGHMCTSLLRQKEETERRKEIEHELRAQRENYYIITENSPDAIFSTDEKGNYTYVNTMHEKILGYTPSELLGRSFFDIFSEDWKGRAQQLQKAILSGRTVSGQALSKRKNLDRIDIAYHIVPLVRDGKVYGATGQVRDITFEKRAEKELLVREEKYRKLFEESPVPLWEFDIRRAMALMEELKQQGCAKLETYLKEKEAYFPELLKLGTLINVNKACMQLYEAKDFAEMKEKFRDNFSRTARKVISQMICAMSQGKKGFVAELDMLDFRGNQKNILVQVMFPEDIKDPVLLVSMTEITRLKQYEKELVEAKKKAEESDKLKTAFLSNISHEIRTPLNGIVGFSRMLAEDDLPAEKKKRFMGLISSNNKQLLDIINDIIDLSRIESGLVELNPEEVDLNNLLEELYLTYLPECERAGIELFFESKGGKKNSVITCDGTKLRQVLNNMLRNALKFTPEGRVTFGFDQKGGDEYYFWVKDTGIGVAREQQKHIFERFCQASQPGLAKNRGSGLGLAISKAYVDMMNGDIGVDSEPGKGSTFWFTTRCMHARRKALKKCGAKAPVDNLSWDEKQIMIVEDERTNTEMIEQMLAPYRIHLLSVSSGEECIGVMKSGVEVDLILMDIKLPGIDGIQTLKELKKMGIDVPVVAQTAFGFEHDKNELLSKGFHAYLSKPLDKDVVMDTMARLLRRKETEKD